MVSLSAPPCAFFVDLEWCHDKGVYRETLRLPEFEMVLCARYRREPAISSSSVLSAPPSPSKPDRDDAAPERVVWSELGSALLTVTAIVTGTRYTIGRPAMREWLAPHATPDAFPGGVLASPVGTEIVAAVSLLVANDEAGGSSLAFSCRGRVHTAAAYYAPSAGRGRYAGLREAFRKRHVAVTVASTVATADRANSIVPSTESPSLSSLGFRQDRIQVDTKGSAVKTSATTALLRPLSLPPPSSPSPSPLSAPVSETAAASPGTDDDIRRRAELLNVYRDLRRRGFDTPDLADHATRTTMATDELAFAVRRLELRDRRCRTATAETNLCKLVAAFVTADSASRVPVD